jgi:hypothetical protein
MVSSKTLTDHQGHALQYWFIIDLSQEESSLGGGQENGNSPIPPRATTARPARLVPLAFV